VKEILDDGYYGIGCVVDDPDVNLDFVLKMLPIGSSSKHTRKYYQKVISQMKEGMIWANECNYFVRYLEVFQWRKFFCIKMEYFKNGSLQTQLRNGRVFTEEVLIFFFNIFL
jgi:serine/threonine protein kinase